MIQYRYFFVVLLLALSTVPAGAQIPIPMPSSASEAAASEADGSDVASSAAAIVPMEHASPQATMRTFLQAFDPKTPLDGIKPLDRAAACLDLSEIPESLQSSRGPILAEQLKEILDRTELIDLEKIPAEPDAQPWRLEVAEGEWLSLAANSQGEWLFHPATVASIPQLLRAAEERDLVSGIVEGKKSLASYLRSRMPHSLRQVGFLLEHWQWLGLLILGIVGLLLGRLGTRLTEGWVRRHLAEHLKSISAGQLHAAIRPMGLLVTALVWGSAIYALGLPTGALAILRAAVRFLGAAAMVWTAYRLVDLVAAGVRQKVAHTDTKMDDLLVPLVRRSLKIIIAVLGGIFIADTLELPLASLLTGLGIGGIALALAAQDTVKNFFGSLTVIIDRPFQVGDWVTMSGVEGEVLEVGFRSTRIRTGYDSMVSLPNANLINASVDNYGARRYRRWKTTLGLTYDTPAEKVEAFCEGVRELIRQQPDTRKESYYVHMTEFGASALEILLQVFFAVPGRAAELVARQRLAIDILRLAERLGVEMAFPTQTLHLQRSTAPEEVAKTAAYGERLKQVEQDARSQAEQVAKRQEVPS